MQRQRIVELERIIRQFHEVEEQIRAGYVLIVGDTDASEKIIREVLISGL